MAKFKFPLICTIAALALSFLLGLISGVRFSTIIFRSLIISLISGVFVLSARILLDRFVPDLFQAAEDKETEKKETGKNLNISIDEPIETPFISDEESSGIVSDIKSPEGADGSILDNPEEFKELESVRDNFDNVKDGSSNGIEKENTAKELEELPDLQDFMPADESQQDDDQMDFTQRGTSAFDVSTDLTGSGMDTNTMVSAIRTVLKRDS